MTEKNSEIRCFMDIDLETMKIVGWKEDLRENLNRGKSPSENVHRVFLTLGQYNKFVAATKGKPNL